MLDSATKEPMFHKRRDGVVCERGRVKVGGHGLGLRLGLAAVRRVAAGTGQRRRDGGRAGEGPGGRAGRQGEGGRGRRGKARRLRAPRVVVKKGRGGDAIKSLCCSASPYGGTGRQTAPDSGQREERVCLHDVGGGVVAEGLRRIHNTVNATLALLALLARGPEGRLPSPRS